MSVIVSAIVTLTVILTTGQSAASRQAVLNTIDTLGTTLIVVSDNSTEGILGPDFVDSAGNLSTVEWSFGLSDVTDAHNSALGAGATPIPVRKYIGTLPDEVTLSAGRMPIAAGEMWLGTTAFENARMESPSGTIRADDTNYAVVGSFAAPTAISQFDELGLIKTSDTERAGLGIRYVYVSATEAASVDEVISSLIAMVPTQDVASISVEAAAGAIALREALGAQLDADARSMLVLVLVVGFILTMVITYVSVSSRRRDIGRRRALGATRSQTVALILLQGLATSTIGALTGTGVGLLIVHVLIGATPGAPFTASVCLLAILVSGIGSIPPAVLAAFTDPVRILRVP
ncbi:FtsX-like permease family protein [Sanguibacter antarcticus]|uniref:Putative ABC transport system permease protein n=1 Tax=Sanguibacter antarcticus TaxID=372484 RepID=A0A2A9E696_9MICO|nr:FtsX-like permease family protein [Sanguibacter antarcticus]PFG34176.1 putative ABC transport system permease protein [Sanguibacter antarcticus]